MISQEERQDTWIKRFYLVSLVLLAASIPLSKYTTSLAQFIVLGIWIFYESDTTYLANFRSSKVSFFLRFPGLLAGLFTSLFLSLIDKFKQFFHNRMALILTSLLLLHLLGLVYTTDFHYAFKDLRTKLPLFLLPLFLSTGPKLSTREFYFLLIGYILAIFGGTLYRLYLYFNLPVADPRAFNAHISHIRFSLNAVYAIFILIYFIYLKNYFPKWFKILAFAMICWLVFILFYLRYTTGISVLGIVGVLLLVYSALRGRTLITRISFLIAGLVLFMLPVWYVSSVVKEYRHTEPVQFNTLDKYTASGNSYYHDTVTFRIENHQYVGLYICDKEMRQEWKKRSSLSIDSSDQKGQPLRYTLIRYLASKDLRKDSTGVQHLTETDIQNIEAGITNPKNQTGFNLKNQIDNFLIGWENYRLHGNPNSSSLIQRLVYWKTSLTLISRHPILGVGTGDVPKAFQDQYRKENSILDPQYRLRSHNQYLSLTVAFGVVGLAWFLFILFYPTLKNRMYQNYFYILFWIIFMISMLTEDTIETQEGVTFYAFFTSLLLFSRQAGPDEQSTV